LAYANNNTDPLDPRSVGILVQVAMKEAAADFRGVDLDATAFIDRLSFYTDALVAEIRTQLGKGQTNSPTLGHTKETYQAAETALAENFGATPVQNTTAAPFANTTTEAAQRELRVLNSEGAAGPLPLWLLQAAAAKGITEVWDNRAKIASGQYKQTAAPFKSSKSQGDVPFWAPKQTVG
jgi:hypothetical protein